MKSHGKAPSAQGFPFTQQRFQLRSDNHIAQQAALRAGIGIGVCPGQLAARDGLIRVLPNVLDFAVDVWIATHRDLRRIPRIHQAFDALAAALEAYLDEHVSLPAAIGDVSKRPVSA